MTTVQNPRKSLIRPKGKAATKDPDIIFPLTIPEMEESEDTMSMISLSSSRELAGDLTLDRSVRSTQSILGAKASSKIPTKPGASKSGTPSRTTSSLLNINISGSPKKSSTPKIKYDLHKIVSPRFSQKGDCQSARSMQAEFKIIAKKYKTIKSEFEEKEAVLGKVRQQLLAFYDKIGDVGSEKIMGENLKDLQEFIIKKKIMSDSRPTQDGSTQLDSTIYEILTVWEETAKVLQEQSTADNSLEFDMEKFKGTKLDEAKSLTKQKLEEVIQVFASKDIENCKARVLLENDVKNLEEAKKGLEGRNEKLESENKELKKSLANEKESSEKLRADVLEKTNEAEKWMENCTKEKRLNQKMSKMMEANEQQLKEQMKIAMAENDELKAKEDGFKRKLESLKEKVKEVTMRENNLKQMVQSMESQGNNADKLDEIQIELKIKEEELTAVTRDKEAYAREVEELKLLVASMKDKLEALKVENEAQKAVVHSGDGMGDFENAAAALEEQRIAEERWEKQEEEARMKKKVQALQDWELDLTYREERLAAMLDINQVKDELVKILKNREKRRIRASHPNYESLCRIVKKLQSKNEALQNDNDLLKKQEELHQRQRVLEEEELCYRQRVTEEEEISHVHKERRSSVKRRANKNKC